MVGNPVFLRTLSLVAANCLPPNKILKIAYLWLMRNNAHLICVVTEVSDKTVTEGRIGGVNVVVEMDESKFGKRKYH